MASFPYEAIDGLGDRSQYAPRNNGLRKPRRLHYSSAKGLDDMAVSDTKQDEDDNVSDGEILASYRSHGGKYGEAMKPGDSNKAKTPPKPPPKPRKLTLKKSSSPLRSSGPSALNLVLSGSSLSEPIKLLHVNVTSGFPNYVAREEISEPKNSSASNKDSSMIRKDDVLNKGLGTITKLLRLATLAKGGNKASVPCNPCSKPLLLNMPPYPHRSKTRLTVDSAPFSRQVNHNESLYVQQFKSLFVTEPQTTFGESELSKPEENKPTLEATEGNRQTVSTNSREFLFRPIFKPLIITQVPSEFLAKTPSSIEDIDVNLIKRTLGSQNNFRNPPHKPRSKPLLVPKQNSSSISPEFQDNYLVTHPSGGEDWAPSYSKAPCSPRFKPLLVTKLRPLEDPSNLSSFKKNQPSPILGSIGTPLALSTCPGNSAPRKASPSKPVALMTKLHMRDTTIAGKPDPTASGSSPKTATLSDFKRTLTSVLRSQTELQLSLRIAPKSFSTAHTVSSISIVPKKLTHINKGRSKGPKRKLPKALALERTSTHLSGAKKIFPATVNLLATVDQPATGDLPPINFSKQLMTSDQTREHRLPPPKGKKPDFKMLQLN